MKWVRDRISRGHLVAECELVRGTRRWLVNEICCPYYCSCAFSNQIVGGPALPCSKSSGWRALCRGPRATCIIPEDAGISVQPAKQTSRPFQPILRILQLLAHTSLPLGERLANLLCEEPHGDHFRFGGTHGLRGCHSALTPLHEHGHRQPRNEWAWPCLKKALSMSGER